MESSGEAPQDLGCEHALLQAKAATSSSDSQRPILNYE